MVWLAPQVATVDGRGTLRCMSCTKAREIVDTTAVWGDCWFSADDVCDNCGAQIEHVPPSGYVHSEGKRVSA